MRILHILLLAALNIGCASQQQPSQLMAERNPQSLIENCKTSLQNFFGRGALSDATNAEIARTSATWNYASHTQFKNAPVAEVMYAFDRLPSAMKELYLATPRGVPGAFRHFEAMSESMERAQGLLADLHQFFKNKAFWLRDSELDFSSWLKTSYSEFSRLGAADKIEVGKAVRRRQLIDGANDFFNASFYAEASVVDQNGKKVVQIGDRFYDEFRIKAGSVQIKVPRDQVVIGADNPLEPAKIQALMGKRGAGKSMYEVNLGLNGAFYIVDGNHRFALYEKRDFVWVEMGSLKSMNIREFRVRTGLGEVDTNDKIRAMRGEIAPLDLLPAEYRHIFVEPSQLRRAEVLPLLDP